MLFENFSVYKYCGLPLGGSIVGLMPNLGTGSCRFGVASPFRPKFVLCIRAARTHRGHDTLPILFLVCINNCCSRKEQLS